MSEAHCLTVTLIIHVTIISQKVRSITRYFNVLSFLRICKGPTMVRRDMFEKQKEPTALN